MTELTMSPIESLGPYLESHVPGFREFQSAGKFENGQSNPTYLITAASGRYVLRAKPPGQLLKSAHQVDREFRVLKALTETKVPVPDVLFLSPEHTPIGRMFFVMRFVDGRNLSDPALSDASHDGQRIPIYEAMSSTLAAIHEVDIERAGLSGFGRPGSYFERQLVRWISQYRASETAKLIEMERLIIWLKAHLPADDGRISLVHGDYRMDNLIFARDKPEVIAVLDWELSTLGHPYADLAYQCLQWRLPSDSIFRGLAGLERLPTGLPGEQSYVDFYCRKRGIEKIENWTFYLAFSFFRYIAICQGLYDRSLKGNASNPDKARQYGESVPYLARLAADLIETND